MKSNRGHERITVGGGCFWCLQPVFEQLRGVEEVIVGYAGGHADSPSYEEVCGGTTGHAEVVQITFDRNAVTLEDLLRVLFAVHDPTTLNRQGDDVGTQYRSVILYATPEQRAVAARVIKEIEDNNVWSDPIVTEVKKLEKFHPAEEYHQHYFEKNPMAGYCRVVIAPKISEFRKEHLEMLKR